MSDRVDRSLHRINICTIMSPILSQMRSATASTPVSSRSNLTGCIALPAVSPNTRATIALFTRSLTSWNLDFGRDWVVRVVEAIFEVFADAGSCLRSLRPAHVRQAHRGVSQSLQLLVLRSLGSISQRRQGPAFFLPHPDKSRQADLPA